MPFSDLGITNKFQMLHHIAKRAQVNTNMIVIEVYHSWLQEPKMIVEWNLMVTSLVRSPHHYRPANQENIFRGTFRVKKKRDLPAKRFGRGTVWYNCEKPNRISVITFNWVICINVGAPRQRYKLRTCKKKI